MLWILRYIYLRYINTTMTLFSHRSLTLFTLKNNQLTLPPLHLAIFTPLIYSIISSKFTLNALLPFITFPVSLLRVSYNFWIFLLFLIFYFFNYLVQLVVLRWWTRIPRLPSHYQQDHRRYSHQPICTLNLAAPELRFYVHLPMAVPILAVRFKNRRPFSIAVKF